MTITWGECGHPTGSWRGGCYLCTMLLPYTSQDVRDGLGCEVWLLEENQRARHTMQEQWRGREAEANACDDFTTVTARPLNFQETMRGAGWTRREVDETIARITTETWAHIGFVHGRLVEFRGSKDRRIDTPHDLSS